MLTFKVNIFYNFILNKNIIIFLSYTFKNFAFNKFKKLTF